MKKTILIIAGFVIIFGSLYLFSTRSSSKGITGIKEEFSDSGFSISGNGKSISAEYVEPSTIDFGLPVYPAAEPIKDDPAAGNFDFGGEKMSAATFYTSDTRDKVERYYMNQFGSEAVTGEAYEDELKFKVIKSKTNSGSFVNVWVENNITYFTIIKPVK